MMTLAQKVWSKVGRRGPDECWPWLGAHAARGYGHLIRGGRGSRFVSAHRAMYEVAVGPVAEGLEVCHSCDNAACCNPAHLWLGSHRDNMRDMSRKQRSPRQKLSQAEVAEIRAAFANGGRTYTDIAGQFGVSRVQIRNIVTNRQRVA